MLNSRPSLIGPVALKLRLHSKQKFVLWSNLFTENFLSTLISYEWHKYRFDNILYIYMGGIYLNKVRTDILYDGTLYVIIIKQLHIKC